MPGACRAGTFPTMAERSQGPSVATGLTVRIVLGLGGLEQS